MSESNVTVGKKIRIVIDTNVWISFFISKALKKLKEYLGNEDIVVLISDELFDELLEVLNRPKISKYIREEDIFEIIGLIQFKAEWIEIKQQTIICRDKKDNFLLDLASNGNADYLITGDNDLLVIEEFEGTKIVDFRSFDRILTTWNSSALWLKLKAILE
jgi:putative PIN family toxin of toxin-antitoxin system